MTIKNNDIDLLTQLLDSKLKNIEDKIDSNHVLQTEIINNILQQTTKTNGRVNRLEERENNHFINCPRLPEVKELNTKIDNINNELSEVRLIKKYPKISFITVGLFMLYIIGTISYAGIEIYYYLKK